MGRGNISSITTKLIQVLEEGTKKGMFLSSVSCPRVLKKPSETEKKKDTKESHIITKVKKEKTEVKLKKLKLDKSEKVIVSSKKNITEKKDKSTKKEKKEGK